MERQTDRQIDAESAVMRSVSDCCFEEEVETKQSSSVTENYSALLTTVRSFGYMQCVSFIFKLYHKVGYLWINCEH